MSSSAAEKAEVDALIAQLSSSRDNDKKSQTNTIASGDASTTTSERKRVQIRRNSGSNSNTQLVGSPTDVHGQLLQKNAKISKKYNRKSRQGKGRGLAKKGGGGGGYTWGALGSELLEEYSEDLDEDDLADLQYNQAKAKLLAESSTTTTTLENKFTKLELIENLDKDVKPLIAEYFVNGDAKDVAQTLRKFDFKQRSGGGELIAYIVTMALEKSNVHKELISRLLHDLNGIILRTSDYTEGYNSLLESLNDLSLDNPECSTDIGKFIARSIADKCIDNTDGKYFIQFKGNVKCSKMQAALDKAETLVSMGDFYFLNNVWNAQSSGFRPVRELADRMNIIIHEYYDSGDVNETIRCLKELNVPHFFHEFVYELMDFSLEKNTERAQQLTINLLETLTKSAVITYDQLKTGMLRLFDDIEDIQLDVPNVYDQLQTLLNQLGEKKIVNQDIISNAPQKGRKRITSEGENNKQDKD
jgi:programmed cell death protein 4